MKINYDGMTAEELQQRLTKNNCSIDELAAKLGVSYRTIYRFLDDSLVRGIRPSTAMAIRAILKKY